MTPEELAKLYSETAAQQTESGVKGEKATKVRDEIRKLVAAMKAQGNTRLSSATIKGVVTKALSTPDVPFKIDATQFSSIIAGMYNTEKDDKTGAVIVVTDTEKPPKERTPRKPKANPDQ